MSELDSSFGSPDLLDLGDVSHDLDALSPLGDRLVSEDSAAEHDYDNISSPGGSSTCSGPTYKRHLGFGPTDSARIKIEEDVSSPPSPAKHSLGNIQLVATRRVSTNSELRPKDARKKKKKSLLSASYDENLHETSSEKPNSKIGGGKFGVLTSRNRYKKEPLPMKMRALPQSFWQQPNNANPLSPGAVYSVLPPLPGQAAHDEDLLAHVPPLADVAGDGAEQVLETRSKSEQRVSEANTDLLFSLFNGVEQEENQKKIHLVRRGRPKKPPPVFSRGRMLQDEDPCLVSNMTEAILPLIPERGAANNNNKQASAVGTQVIKIMSISHGDKSVDLPSLNIEHNYPHLLSELVMKL